MSLFAAYEIGCERLPFVDVASTVPSATLLVDVVPTAPGNTPMVVHLEDGPAPAVERAFETAAFVGEYEVLGETDGTRRYKVRPAQPMEAWFDGDFDVDALRSLAETGCSIDRIRVTPNGWVQTGTFTDRTVLEEFRTFWQDHGSFTLRRLGRERERNEPAAGLTDPQREALLTAHEMGFFDIPRRASLDDVATELDVTASSLSERLRRAQDHLVATTLGAERATMTR